MKDDPQLWPRTISGKGYFSLVLPIGKTPFQVFDPLCTLMSVPHFKIFLLELACFVLSLFFGTFPYLVENMEFIPK